MKNLIYLLLTLLWIVGASEEEEAVDYGLAVDNDLEEYEEQRNLRVRRRNFRTDVRTCNNGHICSYDYQCNRLDRDNIVAIWKHSCI